MILIMFLYFFMGVFGVVSGFGVLGFGMNVVVVIFNDEFVVIWFMGLGLDSGFFCSIGGWYFRTRMELFICMFCLLLLDLSDFKYVMCVMMFGVFVFVGVDKYKCLFLSLDGFVTRFNEYVFVCSSDFGDCFLMCFMI